MRIVNYSNFIVALIGSVGMFAGIPVFVSGFLASDSLWGQIFYGVMAVSGLLVPITFTITGRQWYSYFIIDERGVTNKLFLLKKRDIFFGWNEIADIAVKPIPVGGGLYNHYMYFCKTNLDEYISTKRFSKKIGKLPAYKDSYGVGQTKNLLTIICSKELLDEVLKYVDKDKIRNLETVVQVDSVSEADH